MKTQIKLKRELLISACFIFIALSLYAGKKVLTERSFRNYHLQAQLSADNTAVAEQKTTAKKIKIALLLDTSNSMDGLIDQAKSQLWTIVNELAAAKCEGDLKPEIEIALYEYGNSRLSPSSGYIRLVTPLTYDLDLLSQSLFGLTTSGGDEYCGHVIQTATRELLWSPDGNDLQVIFIAGNEPFTQGNVSSKESCLEAKRKNIIVNTIFCGEFNEGIQTGWKTGADLTGGSYMSIEQNSQTVFIPSPYDDQITQLNYKLNETYIEYGREGKIKKEAQSIQDKNAASYSKSNEVNRAVSKTTHVYKNKNWDLVDASEDESFDVKQIPAQQLPDTMKSMTDEQKEKYVLEKKAEREKIKSDIVQLNKQREVFISKQKQNMPEETKMLDKSMIGAIKKQAETKNLKF